jgi:hypothetical protein
VTARLPNEGEMPTAVECGSGEYEETARNPRDREILRERGCIQNGPNTFCCEKQCPICMEPYTANNPSTTLPCPAGDQMHLACYLRSVQAMGEYKCPICMAPIDEEWPY